MEKHRNPLESPWQLWGSQASREKNSCPPWRRDFNRRKIQDRMPKINNGVSICRVGHCYLVLFSFRKCYSDDTFDIAGRRFERDLLDLVEEFQHDPDLSPIPFVDIEFEDTQTTFWDLCDHVDVRTNRYGRPAAAILQTPERSMGEGNTQVRPTSRYPPSYVPASSNLESVWSDLESVQAPVPYDGIIDNQTVTAAVSSRGGSEQLSSTLFHAYDDPNTIPYFSPI